MTEPQRDPAIRGKIIRFSWSEGPTKGAIHEHTFHRDGTVQWRDAGQSAATREGGKRQEPDRPAYAAIKVSEETYIVSYLAASGYTLTVVLNFRDRQLTGFASSAKDWYPIRGTFEAVS